jgi:hypothetical protein
MSSKPRNERLPYVLSTPERVVRALSALAGGALRELGGFALPLRVRRTRLYRSMVDSTLRFLIEQVGGVEGAFQDEENLPKDFLIRRTAGNAVEVAGIVAFRASPVWALAVLADISGAGRDLVHEIAEELKKEGLLDPAARFDRVDQLLDGLERTAGQLAETVNTPPLDVPTLRKDLATLRDEARRIPGSFPRPAALWDEWRALEAEAAAQQRSVYELSSAIAVSAIRKLPLGAMWLSRALGVGGRRAGQAIASGLLDHYRAQLDRIRSEGYTDYWMREFKPYLAAALRQFSPERPSVTERLLRWRRRPPAPPE